MVDGAKPVSQGNASQQERIEKKMEDKSAESAKADVSSEDGNPGAEDRTPSNKATSSTVSGPISTGGPSSGSVGAASDAVRADATTAEGRKILADAEAQKKGEDEERERLKKEAEKKAVEAEKTYKVEAAQKIKEGVTGTFERKDGTVTSTDMPDRTATYVGGTRVMLTKAEKDEFVRLNDEMNKMQNGRGISDIPVADAYWAKKQEVDQFITNLRR